MSCAKFYTKGLPGLFSGLINPFWVHVRIWTRRSLRLVVADTLGGHMLAGQRRWQAMQGNSKDEIKVTTEAYERPRGWINFVGMTKVEAAVEFPTCRLEYLLRESGLSSNPPVMRSELNYFDASGDDPPQAFWDGPPQSWEPEHPYPGVEVT